MNHDTQNPYVLHVFCSPFFMSVSCASSPSVNLHHSFNVIFVSLCFLISVPSWVMNSQQIGLWWCVCTAYIITWICLRNFCMKFHIHNVFTGLSEWQFFFGISVWKLRDMQKWQILCCLQSTFWEGGMISV